MQLFKAIANDPQFANLLAQVPVKHPTQLFYEAISYMTVLQSYFFLYWKTEARQNQVTYDGTIGIFCLMNS
jgi:hypothetical protein